MERDCMIGHGAAAFLNERLFKCSDKYKIYTCGDCGMAATTPSFCKSCNSDDIKVSNFPYAAKLLVQELNGCGIRTGFKVSK